MSRPEPRRVVYPTTRARRSSGPVIHYTYYPPRPSAQAVSPEGWRPGLNHVGGAGHATVTTSGTIPSKCLRWKFISVCGWMRPFSSVARAMMPYSPASRASQT